MVDISAILPMGQDSSRSLNDDFAATTPSGDSVFSKPLGEKCEWNLPKGRKLSVAFLFDPKQKFSRDNVLASITSDYMADLRDHLTKHLLEEKDIAPKTKTLEETMWDTITTTLPKETLAKNIFNKPEKLEEYMRILKQNVEASFTEETKMTEALKTKDFNFSFMVAIDNYPQEIRNKKQVRGEKTGVLTFYLKSHDASTTAATGDAAEMNGVKKDKKDKKDKKEKEKGESNSMVVSKKRKYDDEKDEPSAKEKLVRELGIKDQLVDAEVVGQKDFPLTATLFFDAFARWFSSIVSSSATKAEKARNRNPLYQ